MSGLLDGHVVIVSGVGPGLGRDLGLACARHGARVVLVARTSRTLDDVAHEIGEPSRTHCVTIDPAEPAEPDRVAAETMERFGAIDGLVNNAAVIPPFVPLADAPDVDVKHSLEANFYTALRLSRAVVPAMRARGRGSIVMVNSAVIRHPKREFGAYSVAKHAMLGLARSLALELGRDGIRVNTLAPGKIDGARLAAYFDMRARERGVAPAEVRAQYASALALGRIPTGAEYADVAVFLLSELSRAVSGHVLDANGGEYFD